MPARRVNKPIQAVSFLCPRSRFHQNERREARARSVRLRLAAQSLLRRDLGRLDDLAPGLALGRDARGELLRLVADQPRAGLLKRSCMAGVRTAAATAPRSFATAA